MTKFLSFNVFIILDLRLTNNIINRWGIQHKDNIFSYDNSGWLIICLNLAFLNIYIIDKLKTHT